MITDLATDVLSVEKWHERYLDIRIDSFKSVYCDAAKFAVEWTHNLALVDLYDKQDELKNELKNKMEPERKSFFYELLPALILNIALGPLSGFVAEVAVKKWALRTRAFAVAEKQFWDGVHRQEMRGVKSILNLEDTYRDNLVLKYIRGDNAKIAEDFVRKNNEVIERSKLLEASAGFVNDSTALVVPASHGFFTHSCVENIKSRPPQTLPEVMSEGLDKVMFLETSCMLSKHQLEQSKADEILLIDNRLKELMDSKMDHSEKKSVLVSLGEYYKNKFEYLAKNQQLSLRYGDSLFIMQCICAILLFGKPERWFSWMDDNGNNLRVTEKSKANRFGGSYEIMFSVKNDKPKLIRALGNIGGESSFFGGGTLGQYFERKIKTATKGANYLEKFPGNYSSDLGINSQRGYLHPPVPLSMVPVPREPIGKYLGSRDYTLEQKLSYRICKFMRDMEMNLYRGLDNIELLVNNASKTIKRQ